MKRLKNYGLWVAIFALVPLMATALKDYNIDVILPENYAALVKAILGILVLAGILNNPDKGKGFKDE